MDNGPESIHNAYVHAIAALVVLPPCPYEPGRFFQAHATASLTRAVELGTMVAYHEPLRPFYVASNLRAICEDVIALSYLTTLAPEHREDFLQSSLILDIIDLNRKQVRFLTQYRPSQPLTEYEDRDGAEAKAKSALTALGKLYGWPRNRVKPTVSHMAREARLQHLYDFIYSGTSHLVHFSPLVLMQMEGPHAGEWSSNQHRGFAEYNLVYLTILTVQLYLSVRPEVDPDGLLADDVAFLRLWTDDRSAWPELLTAPLADR